MDVRCHTLVLRCGVGPFKFRQVKDIGVLEPLAWQLSSGHQALCRDLGTQAGVSEPLHTTLFVTLISAQVRLPPEFKHINKGRKRN